MAIQLTGNDWHASPQYILSEGRVCSSGWSPFGSGVCITGIGFNGERQDPLSQVTHLGNGYRAYSPVLRRFTCPDSASPFEIGGINPYAYCEGDPVNACDPSGHGIITWLIRKAIRIGVKAGMKIAQTEGLSTSVISADAVETGLEAATSAATGRARNALASKNPEMAAKLGWASMATGIICAFDQIEGFTSKIGNNIRGVSAKVVRTSKTAAGIDEGATFEGLGRSRNKALQAVSGESEEINFHYSESGAGSQLTSPAPGPSSASGGSPSIARRQALAELVEQHDLQGSVYVNAVGRVNHMLQRANVGLSERAFSSISRNITTVMNGSRTEAAASLRESRVFFRDTLTALRHGQFSDAATTAVGSVVNLAGSTLYLSHYDRVRMSRLQRAFYDAFDLG
ncbi:RHS repeat-associated core domain-containing protein [Trabulsiella odontotermitis]|uniref:RHS repeat-associated core domain-containing protein n=1 Tax=Trabulsiella odontotermitis TaxID=379893 RepID=UPI00092CF09A|nr:RHS repeat-associated core domain-containing protein [Trabulsiella odontotermitis]